MKLNEWITKYNEKNVEPFKRDERFEFFFIEDKGFCEVGMADNMVVIRQLCGDGRFWYNKVSDMAKQIGAEMCGTWCVRSAIRAYIRLFGYHIVYEEKLSDGLIRYHCRNKENKKGLVSPAFKFKSGEQAYFVTWEV